MGFKILEFHSLQDSPMVSQGLEESYVYPDILKDLDGLKRGYLY